jgi:hypothetical protein
MSISNDRLSFSLGNIQKQDTRTRPSKYAQSALRNWRFEQSEGVRPAEYMGVYKYLPVAFQDTNTEDWVVIPKGRIVSAIGAFNATPLSGIVHPWSSGSIVIGNEGDYMGTGTGAKIEVKIDESFFGYNEHIVNLLVPANGGANTTNYYSTDDVTAGTKTIVGVAAANSGTFTSYANIPIGVAYTDIYQDINGKYLNYRMHEDGYHVLTDWYVEVPFADVGQATVTGLSGLIATSAQATQGHWRPVTKQFTYLTIDTIASKVVTPGMFVCSDGLGNYTQQEAVAATGTTASGGAFTGVAATKYLQPLTAQTVGKLIALDTRMPKDSLQDVLTYPRSGMPGSQTAGMVKNLFDFVYYAVSQGTGTAPTIEQIYTYIQKGVFGLARIQLLVS